MQQGCLAGCPESGTSSCTATFTILPVTGTTIKCNQPLVAGVSASYNRAKWGHSEFDIMDFDITDNDIVESD